MYTLFGTLLVALCGWLYMPVAMAADEAGTQSFKTEEIEALVAPIALYPDALIAQVLMAATYPLEVVEAARWTKANPNIKDKALEDAMQKQGWDASVKSLAAFPQVLTMMNEKLDWTQKLGDAFLAQQKDVLDAVQVLRAKAKAEGNLKSSKEQVVSEVVESGTTVIKVEPADPQVVYVPTYNPTVVYGTWPYPYYSPYYYYPPGYVAGAAISFGVGLAIGSALWGNCNWGGGNVNINVNRYNNFNRTNISNGNWNHNVDHRKGVQYRDSASRERYGRDASRNTAASRDAFRGRAEQGRSDIAGGAAKDFKGGAAGSRDGSGRDGAGRHDAAGKAGGRSNQLGNTRPDRSGNALQGMDNAGRTRDMSSRGASSRNAAATHRSSAAPRARSGGGGHTRSAPSRRR
ncbi:DUF3300 domain-containing protein [Andreprevotia sp. IGB-42]|uniref:DUF3300 domain-containing protein n=1 Tax=Andreprevotia sp. IGB-42 TaxID=2497473 RepID=UPI00191ECA43|nr:DUF3300 domain-containing protein [Andreprevotia sp. IGB-42]